MATDIPPSIVTPETLQTRLGRLQLHDGFPDDATVEKVYDNLDFERGVQAFLNNLGPATLVPYRKTMTGFGAANSTVAIFENLLDSHAVVPTANSETVYAMAWLDLKSGPIVAEIPPGVLGFVLDFWSRYVTDMGTAGPDKGKGGKYLFVPPDYTGEVPDGYYVCKSPTFGNVFIFRGFVAGGDTKPTVENIKKHFRMYPLAQASKPVAPTFVNASGTPINAVCSLDFSFYEAVNEVVQEEPRESLDPETLGTLASIGIEKGKPFAPDARMKKILTDAVNVGSATARALAFRPRMKDAYLYPNSAWMTPFVGGSYEFERDNVGLLDPRTFFYFWGWGSTPALSIKMVGLGSQYALAAVDEKGAPLDGGTSYVLHLPPNIPAKNFWSIIAYDNQTRSMLQTDQQFPSVSSQKTGLVVNADTSVDVYFGPTPAKGKEQNWIQTLPGKGFTVALRLYGPLEPWFDKSWRPAELKRL